MPGSEAVNVGPNGAASGWLNAIVPAKPDAKPADFNLAEGVMRYLILDPPQPGYDAMTFDYDRETALVERWNGGASWRTPKTQTCQGSGSAAAS